MLISYALLLPLCLQVVKLCLSIVPMSTICVYMLMSYALVLPICLQVVKLCLSK